jgi:hypothetical protein
MKNPPILISVLGFFAALAGFAWIFFGLRVLGFDWFGALGDLPQFDSVGIWGWLALGLGILWLVVAVGLWGLQGWAWMVAMIVAGLALFQAFIAFIQFPGTGYGFAMALLPLVIILYLNSASVKAAFDVSEPPPAA